MILQLFPYAGADGNKAAFVRSTTSAEVAQIPDLTCYAQPTVRFAPVEQNPSGAFGARIAAFDGTGCTAVAMVYTKAAGSAAVPLGTTEVMEWNEDGYFEGTLDLNTTECITATSALAAGGNVSARMLFVLYNAAGKPVPVEQPVRVFYTLPPDDLPAPTSVTETIFANLLELSILPTDSIAWPRDGNTFSPYVRRKTSGGIYEDEDGLFVRPFFDGPGILDALSVQLVDVGGGVVSPSSDSAEAVMGGVSGKRYAVRLHCVLAIELHPATGGESKPGDPSYFRRGTPTPYNNLNLATLTVSSPAAVYQLNYRDSNTTEVNNIDYYADVIIDAGATVTLLIDSRDGAMTGSLQTAEVTLDQAAELDDSQLDRGVLVVSGGESLGIRKLVWQDMLDAVGGGPELWYYTAPLTGRIGPRIGITTEAGGVVDLLSDLAWGVHLEDAETDPKVDFTGGGHSLLENGATWVNLTGKLGNAYRIADVNAGKLWRNHASCFAIGTAFTYAGWFRNDQNTSNAEGPLVCKANEYLLTQTGTDLQLTVYLSGGAAGAVITVPQPAATEWFFVVWQVDGTTCRLSLNGGAWIEAAQATVNPTGADFSLSDGATQMGGDTYWDEQAIWQRALTFAEVRALYNDGAGVEYPYTGVDGVAPVRVRIEAGEVAGFSALVAGEPVYLDPDTSGGLTQTRPAEGKPVRLVGFARDTETIYFEPRRETDEIASNIVKAAVTTTDDTPTDLVAIYGSLVLANNSARAFSLLVKSERTGTHGSVDMWQFTGIIKRDANAASTALTLIPGPYTGLTACVVALTEDTSAGALKITVTNPDAQTWRSTALLTWL